MYPKTVQELPNVPRFHETNSDAVWINLVAWPRCKLPLALRIPTDVGSLQALQRYEKRVDASEDPYCPSPHRCTQTLGEQPDLQFGSPFPRGHALRKNFRSS